MLLPEGAKFHAPWIVLLTVVNVVYGSFIAMVQKDMKYMIGFSSVSHMGLVAMALMTLNRTGYVGAGMQMFSHGVMTALFFACVGMIYDRAHTRMMPELGGMVKKMPFVAVAFIIGGFTSMGMPGLSGFAAELPIFLGVWNAKAANVVRLPGWLRGYIRSSRSFLGRRRRSRGFPAKTSTTITSATTVPTNRADSVGDGRHRRHPNGALIDTGVAAI
jgi:NADH:ubiquinone oxidoreductase subunit 4 (subunit M)